MNMVEKVARAIFDTVTVEGVTLAWEAVSEGHRELCIEQAVAAIDAMGNPTNAMLRSAVRYGDSEGYGHLDEMDALRVWEDMMSAVDISDAP